jgi:hypothetical protein
MRIDEYRERIKRQISYDAFPRENKLDGAWRVDHYVHVDGERYPVIDLGDKFLVCIAVGVHVYGDTLEQARDAIAEALA